MDIKEMINDVVEKITKNDDLIENFKKDPIKTVESVAAAEPVKVEVQPTTDNVTTTNNVNNGMNI